MIEEFQGALNLLDQDQLLLRGIAAGAGAVALSLTSAFVVPKIVDLLLPSPTHDSLWQFLSLEKLLADGKTIAFKNHHYARVIDLRGADIALASPDQKIGFFEARKRMIDELERCGLQQVKFLHIKDRVTLQRHLRPHHPLLETIDKTWEATAPQAYNLTHAIILIAKSKKEADALATLEAAETIVIATMAPFGPKIMIEPIGNDAGDSPLKPLARVLSPVSKPSPRGRSYRGPLSALLTGDDVDFSHAKDGIIKFHAGAKTKFGCVVTWRDCGEKTSESVIQQVMALDSEMIVYHAVEPIPTAHAILELNRSSRAAVSEHLSLNAAEEINGVIRQVEGVVAGEKASLVYYATHIIPVADSIEELSKIVTRMMAIMTQTAGTLVRLKETAQPTFMSSVSTDLAWPRKFRFLSTNVASQIVPQKSKVGFTRSDWAEEPIAWFRTVQGDPYPFHFHSHEGNQAPAHTVIFGPTGSGKAQPLHSGVLTPTGFRRKGDLRPGDPIMGDDGKVYFVEGVFPQGVKPRFLVRLADGRSTECCDEHNWDVLIPNGSLPMDKRTITLREIIARRERGEEIRLPVGAPMNTRELTECQTYNSRKRHLNGAVDTLDITMVNLDGMTLPAGKHFPIEQMNGSVEQKLGLLAEFIEQRAFRSPSGLVSFATTDKAIMADIVYLVRSLGGVAYTTGGAPVFMTRITFRLPDGLDLPCPHAARGARDDRLADISSIPILEILELSPCEMVCIKTSNPSSLYVTDDFIITHNTSLLTFLAAQASRVPKLRTFLLDRHNGMKIFSTVAGGRYVTFDGSESSAALNPFHLKDTPENRKFLLRWLRALADVDDARANDEIARAISVAYDTGQPLENRSLARIARAAFSARSDVRRNLDPWINPEAYGGFFNAAEDNLDLADAKIIGFDMTNILSDEKLAPPLVDYLVHRIKTLSIDTADPTLVIVDETAPMLRNEKFAKSFLTVGLAEGRKLRAGYNLCFQTPAALEATGVAQIVLDQCQKIMFYRNPRDSDQLAAQYEMFGLNQAEIDFIAGRTYREWPYAVLIKNQLSGESSIVDVNLSRLGPYLGAFESDARQVLRLGGLMEQHSKDEAINRYFSQRGR